jgi:hypothetical protein
LKIITLGNVNQNQNSTHINIWNKLTYDSQKFSFQVVKNKGNRKFSNHRNFNKDKYSFSMVETYSL